MKKIIIIVLLLFILVGCETTPTDSGEPTPSVPNGLEPLTAVDDCDVPTLEGGWVCIWADEFEGPDIDEDKWNFEIDGGGGGNNELQYYRKENASIENGNLIITANRESFGGRQYTSARMTTKYKGTFEYVRIVVSAKMPTGRGTWPAIWMMPLMNSYGGWPNSGEIDIVEYVGYDPTRIHSTIHTKRFNHMIGTQIGFNKVVENLDTEFHEYEMIWSPGNIQSFHNGEKYAEFNYVAQFTQDAPYHEAFPFDQPFYLILNLAIGGNWGGVQGVDDSIFPATFEIEHVRVYKQDYAVLDKEAPTTPEDLQLAQLKNTIFWKKSTDDYGVEEYAVYLDGAFHRYASLNQITFNGLIAGETYQVQVQAVDFVGRTSELSDVLLFTYSG
ncbi:MAG: family 16 glycosylhydrolase [Acholeplasmataceae bacterium]|nr:family 16 glycosylhydrolase [Acholeplasmataceae bacterium]